MSTDNKKKKVLLAFSGGLDTSFAVKYLSEDLGYEVHTAIANTGGFSPEELAVIEEKAKRLGAYSHSKLAGLEKKFLQYCASHFRSCPEKDSERQRMMDVSLADIQDSGVIAGEYGGKRRRHAGFILSADADKYYLYIILVHNSYFLIPEPTEIFTC